MFDRPIDSERLFDQDVSMTRTDVRRRRRLALAALGVAVAVVLSAPVAGALSRGEEPRTEAPAVRSERVYVVRAGDTLWSIAQRLVDGADPRALVDAIVERNGIDPGAIVPGQAIVIPRDA